MKKVPGRNGGTINRWEKGESGNPRGSQTRKLTRTIIKELEAKGIKGLKPGDVIAIFQTLLDSTFDELKAISEDDNAPYFVRRTATEMTKGKGWEIMERMIDRAHGKAKGTEDVNIRSGSTFFNLMRAASKEEKDQKNDQKNEE